MVRPIDRAASHRHRSRRRAASGRSGGWPLHMLVNNAWIMAGPLLRAPQVGDAVRHQSPLATGLHDALAAAHGARIVAVSSGRHINGNVDFDDLNFERPPYDPWLAYGQSKTADLLFAVEAAKRWSAEGITANALNPVTSPARTWVGTSATSRTRRRRSNRPPPTCPGSRRAGRRHVGPARPVAAGGGRHRTLLRGLRGSRPQPARRASRGGRLRARPRGCRPALAGLRRPDRHSPPRKEVPGVRGHHDVGHRRWHRHRPSPRPPWPPKAARSP
jgi:NAD(P)-dependent dehydrogenase (short-subunit alcohol dehydrogenase family)